MNAPSSTALPDFDILAKLAVDDPAAFEKLRTKLLQDAINEAPEQYRPSLTQTVVKLNQERARVTSPLEAAQQANQAMMASFGELNLELGRAAFALKDLENTAVNAAAKANPAGVHKPTFIV